MIKHIEDSLDLFIRSQISYQEVVNRLTGAVFFSFIGGVVVGIFITIVLYATR